jgi:phosphate transport system permease protein
MSENQAATANPTGGGRSFSAGKRVAGRRIADSLFQWLCFGFALVVVVAIIWIGVRLFLDSSLTRHRYGTSFITTSTWDVPHEIYGALPVIFGTLVSSALALVIAVPLSVGAAVFLTEIAPKRLANLIASVIELLAAIPSVIFGLWGFLVLCPFLLGHVSPWLSDHLGANPLFGGTPLLNNMLAAGVILAIMILPIITTISREVLLTIPSGQREASLGLGATKWETIKNIILKEAKSGITGAVVLGLGRALGETMAVVMVIGNNPKIAASLLQPGYTMPSLLANTFNEAQNDDLQRSALLEIALILFVVTVLVNGLARLLLILTTKELSGGGKDESPWSKRFRVVFEGISRFAFVGLITAFVGFQIMCDLRVHGLAALGGPVEIVTFAAILYQVFAGRFAGSLLQRHWRRITNWLMHAVLSSAAFLACFILGALLVYVAIHGFRGLSVNLFTELPRPPGMDGGGLKNAIMGTIELVAIASCIGIPVGLMGGIFVAEFGKKPGSAVRFAADVLNGIPSVVIGLFAYAAFVIPFKHFSGWAGAGALAIMMIPTIMRTTEEMLKLVPGEFRAAALALGASKVHMIRTVAIPAARSGIITGVMLAIARIAGETAPLLFTAFGSEQLAHSPSEPTSTLTMKIYQYAISPYDDQVNQAWAGALILLIMILVFNIIARTTNRRRFASR